MSKIVEVVSGGLCTACGGCVGVCPYIKSIEDRVAVIEDCGVEGEGRCYYFCPRTFFDVDEMNGFVFGGRRSEEDVVLGRHISVLAARAKSVAMRKNAQYGGVVSTIISHALETGEIEAAVLTSGGGSCGGYDGGGGELLPTPVIARSKGDVLSCAKTKYFMGASLSALNKALKEGFESVGVVGTPCQIQALRKMQAYGDAVQSGGIYEKIDASKSVKLVVGLFCMWALSYDFLWYLRKHVELSAVRKLDIPVGGFLVFGEDFRKELPLEEVRRYVRHACDVCYDMTSEFADISVGALEGVPDWNTVILRTKLGERIFREAEKAGVLEVKELEVERLEHLRWASLRKKAKAWRRMHEFKVEFLRISELERGIVEGFPLEE
ncbi:Coenzyme F420 hydrogenase/dehydrogenase, beta subunit C-terminal domain [Candidatus Alkanophaga liquidiphilum]